jgi:dinuclear metal center YbgI/SA1388 family protein
MRTVAGAVRLLDETIRFDKAAAWDAVGLQIGDPDATAMRIGVCHDVTDHVIEAAMESELDLLIAYHPLLLSPVRRLVAGAGVEGRAWRLARSGIALVVVHTAFDVVTGGAADALAAALDLGDLQAFGPLWGADAVKIVTFVPEADADRVADAMARAGAGTIGAYSHCSFRIDGAGTFLPGPGSAPVSGEPGVLAREPEVRIEMVAPQARVDSVVEALVAHHPYDEAAYDVYDRKGEAGFIGRAGRWAGSYAQLVAAVEASLDATVRSTTGLGGGPLQVGVVPGSGGAFVGAAIGLGLDVLVTGDVKHHEARAAVQGGLAVIDAGHAATERPGLANLYAAAAGAFGEVVDLTGVDPDPWTR